MKNKILRLLSAVLLCLMLSAVCASCKKDGNDGNITTTAPVGDTTNLHQALGMEIRDYTGKQMKIWYSFDDAKPWSAYPLRVSLEESEVDIIYKAGYKRNEEMKKRIGVEVVYTVRDQDPIYDVDELKIIRKSGDDASYDMIITQGIPAGTLALEGFWADLSLSPHINADQYYYENSINGQLKLGKKQFFAMGYFSWANTAATDTTYANMEILEDKARITKEELYDLALNNKFTLDKMLEHGKANFIPENGNTDYKTAKLSYIHSYNYSSNLFFNLGGDVVTYDKENNKYNMVFSEAHNLGVYSTIKEKIYDNVECMFVTNDEHNNAFMLGCAPFLVQHNHYIEDLGSSAIVDKTIFLPPPLMNEGDPYRALCHAWNLNVAGIPASLAARDSALFDKAGYLYEFFMVASYEIVYPAFYEKTFKTRYQPDATSRKVFDICQGSKVIDIASSYNLYGDKGLSSAIREGMSPSIAASKVGGPVKKNLEKINQSILN